MGVIGVQDHQDFLAFDTLANLLDDCRIDTRTLDHPDPLAHRVRFDRLTVVLADIDVDAQHFAMADQFQHRGVKHQRAAVGNTGLDNDVRPQRPDDLLHGDHVLGKLNDRAAHPAEVVGVLMFGGRANPVQRRGLQRFVLLQAFDVLFYFFTKLLMRIHYRLSGNWCGG
ncbi:hypothetical protein D3C78_1336360 [compost metagenome]